MPPNDEDFLAHYGIKGMKWGKRKAESSSGPSERQIKRAQYKKDLKEGNIASAKGQPVTEAQAKAMRTNGIRTTAALMAAYGAVQIGSYAVAKGIASSNAKKMADFEAAGEKLLRDKMPSIGDLSTYALRLDSDGTWR